MKHLLTPLQRSPYAKLVRMSGQAPAQFIRVENGRFVGGSANSGYFVGANFGTGLLCHRRAGRDRDRLAANSTG